jgi:cobalt/nickel transport system permease protein
MHIPDGFLDAKTAGVSAVLAVGGIAIALRHARTCLPRSAVPLLGLAASFVFAAQMLNFPVAGGTSGHLVGGTLLAVLLGPSAAILAITCVLIVQCLAFADGGLLALGANILNMGIIVPTVGYLVYALVAAVARKRTGRLIGLALGAWVSTVLAAAVCAGELAASGTVAWNLALPAMAGVHAIIGIGEAAITVAVVMAVWKARPELAPDALALPGAVGGERVRVGDIQRLTRKRELVAYGVLVSIGLALFVSPLASSYPDGLEKFAEKVGIKEAMPLVATPLADYKMPGIYWDWLSKGLAGVLGALVVLGIATVIGWALLRRGAVGATKNPL